MLVWLKFLICAAVIFVAGTKLTKYGDAIAEKTGLCRAWIGLVLLAAVTSLPEVANGISAAALAKVPDLAFGDILGACMINMFTLALLNLIWKLRGKPSMFSDRKEGNIITTLYGVVILLFCAAALVLSNLVLNLSLWGVSIYSIILMGIYLFAQKLVYAHSRGEETAESAKNYAGVSLTQVYFFFLLSAAAVVAAGSWLPFIGNEIVATMGWGRTFVAVLFLGFATTLPETTVSFSALRLKEVGMSIGNLVGSNIFNLSIIFWVDLFYRQGSLFAAVSPNMIYAALFGALLMAVAYFALVRQIKSYAPSIIIILGYLASLFFLYQAGAF